MQFRRIEVGIAVDDEGRSVPAEIIDNDRHERIKEILDRGQEGGSPGRPEIAYFKVKTNESRIYILRQAMIFDAWGACEL